MRARAHTLILFLLVCDLPIFVLTSQSVFLSKWHIDELGVHCTLYTSIRIFTLHLQHVLRNSLNLDFKPVDLFFVPPPICVCIRYFCFIFACFGECMRYAKQPKQWQKRWDNPKETNRNLSYNVFSTNECARTCVCTQASKHVFETVKKIYEWNTFNFFRTILRREKQMQRFLE